MKRFLALTLALPLLIAAAPDSAAREDDPRTRFQSLFVRWNAASRESIEAEQRPQPAAAGSPASSAAGTRALGERVGEIVARGDCSDGERVARAAGDFALVAAVREHCSAVDRGAR